MWPIIYVLFIAQVTALFHTKLILELKYLHHHSSCLLLYSFNSHRNIFLAWKLDAELSFVDSAVCDGHFPGINDFYLILCGIVEIEVTEAWAHKCIVINEIVFSCREASCAAGNFIPFAWHWFYAKTWGFFHNFCQEFNALRGGSVQNSAV